MGDIEVPKPQMSESAKVNFATEVAFGALIEQAKRMGLELAPVMGLMYLPDQQATKKFQQACRNVLQLLSTKPSSEE